MLGTGCPENRAANPLTRRAPAEEGTVARHPSPRGRGKMLENFRVSQSDMTGYGARTSKVKLPGIMRGRRNRCPRSRGGMGPKLAVTVNMR